MHIENKEREGERRRRLRERGASAFSHHLRLLLVLRYTAAGYGCCVSFCCPTRSSAAALSRSSLCSSLALVMKRVRVFPLSATLFFFFSLLFLSSPTRFSGVMKLITLRALYSSTSLTLLPFFSLGSYISISLSR